MSKKTFSNKKTGEGFDSRTRFNNLDTPPSGFLPDRKNSLGYSENLQMVESEDIIEFLESALEDDTFVLDEILK